MSFRRAFRSHKLSGDEDIFHRFEWPAARSTDEEGRSNVGGRPRFKWTAQMSLHLIILVIHTDMYFDDITAAIKDEHGHGRNHWHEIFGYDPSIARLSDPAAQRRRTEMQAAAFRAFRRQHDDENAETQHKALTQSQQRDSTSASITPPRHINAGGSIVDSDDDLIYSQSFISWIMQNGLQVGRQDISIPHSVDTPPYGQSSIPPPADHSFHASVCRILESYRATDGNLPSITAVIQELLQNRAAPSQANANGETPLHLAVALGHIPIVTLLLEYGADTSLRTGTGESIWQFGARASHDLMLANNPDHEPALLERAMACARIEFARSTVEFNPNLIFKGAARRQDRRGHSHVITTSLSLHEPNRMDQHLAGQQVMVNPVVDQDRYWETPNILNDLHFLPWPDQFENTWLNEELAWITDDGARD
ncbi:hypothetical protein PRZ48_007078 [Zasmidium cellare]|uniref:Ankyrin repeat domain-containing protein 54 n=1 Tax=Zasmidium cellare TaxID=395010 RepID=A0ABR0EID2_ZASCE|nr:hypothetical protein PRZ48_007078 [Zasmidium cellare]